jgi:hypothetical protein
MMAPANALLEAEVAQKVAQPLKGMFRSDAPQRILASN